jgi:hypothetical protein
VNQHLCVHILRNPYGHTPDEIRAAQLFACDQIEHWQDAYTNMRAWAEKNGVDTVCQSASTTRTNDQ